MGTMRSCLVTAAFVFSLTGVASAAPPADQGAAWRTAEAKFTACFEGVGSDPIFAAVNAKFALRSPAPAQFLDKRVPDEGEAETLRLRTNALRACREMRRAAVRMHHPDLEPAYQMLDYQADQVSDYLLQRAIDYGTANRLSETAQFNFNLRALFFHHGTADERATLAQQWRDSLARAHSNPAPTGPDFVCDWHALNIRCE
jgi:hypothetical protein